MSEALVPVFSASQARELLEAGLGLRGSIVCIPAVMPGLPDGSIPGEEFEARWRRARFELIDGGRDSVPQTGGAA